MLKSNEIRAAIVLVGKTQAQVAKEVGISVPTLCRWLTVRDMPVRFVPALAEAAGIERERWASVFLG